MSDEPARPKSQKLGRGLSALLGDESDDQAQLDRLRQTRTLPVERLTAGPFQPRRRFDQADLEELAESIREQGLLQPILVRRNPDGEDYQIIAGERRWRAAQLAQLHEVPVLVREFDDRVAMEIALVENVQRKDLSPLEEAEGYRRLSEEYGHSQDDIARSIGKSRSHVANTLRLLNLPDDVQVLLGDGQLTAGHARALLGLDNAVELARDIVTRKLSVRETERLVQKARAGDQPAASKRARPQGRPDKDADTRALERDLSERLGLKVAIDHRGGGGSVTIHYGDLEQLDMVIGRLSGPMAGAERATDTVDDGWSEDSDDDQELPSWSFSGEPLGEMPAARGVAGDDPGDDPAEDPDDDLDLDADDPLVPRA